MRLSFKHKNEMIHQNFRIGEINYLRLLLHSHFRLSQNHVSNLVIVSNNTEFILLGKVFGDLVRPLLHHLIETGNAMKLR